MNEPSRAQVLIDEIEVLTRRIAARERETRLLKADKLGLQRQLDSLNQLPLPLGGLGKGEVCICSRPDCGRPHTLDA